MSNQHNPNNQHTNVRRHGSPVPKILLGLALLAFFVIGSVLHVQTSEAFFLGSGPVNISPNWSVLLQPWQLIHGELSPRMSEATMWGWGIELVFLICVFGYEVAHDAVLGNSRKMAGIFRTGMLVLIVFDGYTDFQYGNIASGFWGQLGFALITAFVVFFFGTIGWKLVESGLADWNRTAPATA